MSTPAIIEHPSPNWSARKAGVRVDTVLLHHTGGKSDKGALHWLCLPKGATYKVKDPKTGAVTEHIHKSPVSAHYVVGTTGEVYRLVSEDRAAKHAGLGRLPWDTCKPYDFNHRSVGIEVVNPGDGVTPFTEAQYTALEWLVPDIVRRHGWGVVTVSNPTGDGSSGVPGFKACLLDVTRDSVSGHVLGHRDTAPGRKTDPADNFDWARVRTALAGNDA